MTTLFMPMATLAAMLSTAAPGSAHISTIPDVRPDEWVLVESRRHKPYGHHPRHGVHTAHPVTWDDVSRNWSKYKAKARRHWSELTESDVDAAAGQRDAFVDKLIARYGVDKDEGEQDVDLWLKTMREPTSPAAALHGRHLGIQKSHRTLWRDLGPVWQLMPEPGHLPFGITARIGFSASGSVGERQFTM